MGALDDYIVNEYVQERIEQSGDAGFTCKAAEESILRRMLKAQEVAEELSSALTGKDFADVDYGRIFNAIQAVIESQRGVDVITVEEALGRLFPKNAKRLKDRMVVLMKYTGYSEDDTRNVADHVQIVKELSARRQAIKNVEQLMADLHDSTKNVKATLTNMESAAEGIDTTGVVSNTTSDVLMETYEYVERRSNGEIASVSTGISTLDRLIGGFFSGELTIVAARPSVGKTAFGLNVAISAAMAGHKVGFISCEMSVIGLGQRLFSRLALINGMDLRKAELDPEMWSKMADALVEGNELPIDWVFDNGIIEDVVRWAKRKAKHGDLDILVVDYLQFMDTNQTFKEERLRVGRISRELKKLARAAKIPVIVLAQVTREGEGVMPTMKMLKESGNIEQDADGIIFLHNPNSPDDKCVDPRDKEYFYNFAERGITYQCIGVAKQRNGVVGQVSVAMNPAYMLYTAIGRE